MRWIVLRMYEKWMRIRYTLDFRPRTVMKRFWERCTVFFLTMLISCSITAEEFSTELFELPCLIDSCHHSDYGCSAQQIQPRTDCDFNLNKAKRGLQWYRVPDLLLYSDISEELLCVYQKPRKRSCFNFWRAKILALYSKVWCCCALWAKRTLQYSSRFWEFPKRNMCLSDHNLNGPTFADTGGRQKDLSGSIHGGGMSGLG